MIVLASTWLALAVLLCAFAWFSSRRFVCVSLPFAVMIAAFAIYLPTGSPRFTKPPPGDYQVLGAKIVPNVGIWALLDDGKGEPQYFRLPYSTKAANDLQSAQDGEGGVKATVGTDGGVAYDGEEPVTGEPPKAPEQPQISLP